MVYDDSSRLDQTYGNGGPGAVLNIISFVGIVVGFFLIANRLYWRWKKGTPGIDDVVIVFAWIAMCILGVVTYMAVDYGYGRPSASLTRSEASDAVRMFYLYQIFYKVTLNLSKLSILTLYLRVFDTHDWFGRITKFMVALVVLFTVAIIFVNVFICTPIKSYWNTYLTPSEKAARCVNVLGYWYASSLYNIISETVMLLSVLVRIWTLPSYSHPPILQFRQKINLTVMLGLGVFTIVTAILRVTTLNQAAVAADTTGGTRTSTIWSSAEACLGLIIANLPMLRQLLRWRGWYGGRWFSSTADKSRGQSHSRQRSAYTPTPQYSSRDPEAWHPTLHPATQQHESLSSPIPPQEIHMQRDFQRREVMTHEPYNANSFSSSPSLTSDTHGSTTHIEFGTVNESSNSDFSMHHPDATTLKYDSYSHSNTPSIGSQTLRFPTEPRSIVRTSTEPSTSIVQTVRGGAGTMEFQLQALPESRRKKDDGVR